MRAFLFGIFWGLVFFFGTYFVLKKSGFDLYFAHTIIDWQNKCCNVLFDGVYIAYQELNSKPKLIRIGDLGFELEKESPTQNYDCKWTLINSRQLIIDSKNISSGSGSGINIKKVSAKISLWEFYLLPMLLLLSLYVIGGKYLYPGTIKLIMSLLFLLCIFSFFYFISLYYLRISSPELAPPADVPITNSIIAFLFRLQQVEFSYVLTLLIWLGFCFPKMEYWLQKYIGKST